MVPELALRIRTIKPGIWDDEVVADVSRDSRLLFMGLITQADDDGYLRGTAKWVKSKVFPYDDDLSNDDVKSWITELNEAGLIVLFDVGKNTFIWLPNWHKHQRTDKRWYRPTEHPLAPNDEATASARREHYETTTSAPRGHHAGSGSGSGSGSGKERKPPSSPKGTESGGAKKKDPKAEQVRQVFAAWIEATNRTDQTKLDDKRRRQIQKALSLYPLPDVLDAVRGVVRSSHHMGQNDQQTKYDGLNVILRDAEQIEKFRDLHRNGNRVAALSRPHVADEDMP